MAPIQNVYLSVFNNGFIIQWIACPSQNYGNDTTNTKYYPIAYTTDIHCSWCQKTDGGTYWADCQELVPQGDMAHVSIYTWVLENIGTAYSIRYKIMSFGF